MAISVSRGKKTVPQKVVIYGSEGVGKSTLASQFPDPLFIDVEGSTERLDVARIDPAPKNWQELLDIVDEVAMTPDLCQSLIIDTIDWAERIAASQVCIDENVKGIEKIGYSKGYKYLADKIDTLLNKLTKVRDNGKNVVLLAHAAMRKFEQPEEQGAYDRWELKLTKHVAPLVKEWADMILFLNYKTYVVTTSDKKSKASGSKRVMYAQHHECWDAKNRHDLPAMMDLDYKNIAHCFATEATSTKTQFVQTLEAEVVERERDPLPVNMEAVNNSEKIVTKKERKPAPKKEAKKPEQKKVIETPLGALQKLMDENFVTKAEIEEAVAMAKFYPSGTDMMDYDPQFIKSKLVDKWDGFLKFINDKVRSIDDEDMQF